MNHKTVVCLLFLLFPVGFFFVPLWVQDHTFAYRDSARFYHRQFEWNQAQWTKGEVPLWNPQENLGAAIVGEASSSVFYPLQLLFLLPIPFGRAFVLYAALHVYLASVGAFFFSRALGCRDEAAVFCGMSYSLCGSVIFQTCNIVFLIGASWLPFCVWMSYLLCRVPRLSCTGWLGIFMGLTILGGEPQTAYHVGILSGLLISTNWWRQRGRLKSSEIKKSVGCHALAVLIAFAIAAIQIFPTWQATQTSTRSDFVKARSIWELGSSRRGSMAGGIFGHPVAGTHHDHLYQFSQAPWTVAELVWPNVSGKIQPRYGRWSEAIPAASRTWTPSIYCGLIAFVFLISAMTRRSPRDDDRWLKLGFAVFALGSLGWFGLGWVAHEAAYCLFRSDPAASWIGAPVGGMYWFFVVCLPGYVKFRYPAKLFIVASLLMCVIASRELQRVIRHEQFSQVRRQFVGVVLVSLVVLVTLWFSSIPINRWFQYLFETVSTEFGPFQPAAAWRAILEGLIHAFVLGMMVIALINQGFRPQLLARLLVLLALCDLTVANRGLIFSAPSEIWQRTSPVAEKISEADGSLVRVFRTDPMDWSVHSDWLAKDSPRRIEEIIKFENETLMPKNHLQSAGLSGSIGLVESFRTLQDLRFGTLMAHLKNTHGISAGEALDVTLAPDPAALGMLSCKYLLVPSWGNLQCPKEHTVAVFPSTQAILIRNPYFLDRFRITQRVKSIPKIGNFSDWLSEKENQKVVRELVSFAKNHRLGAIVEADGDSFAWEPRPPEDSWESGQIKIIQETNTSIELQVESGGGLLVIADAYDKDWEAYRLDDQGSSTRLPVYRANFVMRGIPLPSGTVTIRMTYCPRGIYWGAGVSFLGFLMAMGCLAIGRNLSSRRSPSSQEKVPR